MASCIKWIICMSRKWRRVFFGVWVALMIYTLISVHHFDMNNLVDDYYIADNTSSYTWIPGCFLGKYCVQYLTKPSVVCEGHNKVKLLVLVLSSRENQESRQRIRQSWGNTTLFKDIKVVFLLGQALKPSSKDAALEQEAGFYKDIIMSDFIDSYNNLTLKTLTGFHWTTHFCPKAKFILKADDDVLINTVKFLQKVTEMIQQNKTTRVLAGKLWLRSSVQRVGKYSVSNKYYRNKYYPTYCSGPGYLMSADTLRELYRQAMLDRRTTLLKMEDVYYTGILAHEARIERKTLGCYSYEDNWFPTWWWWNTLLWHNSLSTAQQQEIWTKISTELITHIH